jgi:serine protease AprX
VIERTKRDKLTLSRKDLEDVIFRTPSVRRFTQDSPILPDVWFAYGQAKPSDRIDLLMVPYRGSRVSATPGEIAVQLRKSPGLGGAHVAYHQSTTVASLTFRELVQIVLPLANWREEFWSEAQGWLRIPSMTKAERDRVAVALMAFERGRMDRVGDESQPSDATSPLVLWTVRLVGTIALAHAKNADLLRDPKTGAIRVPLDRRGAEAVLAAAAKIIDPKAEPHRMIFSVSLNRDAEVTVFRSVATVKADAARRLFNIDATGLRWAVIDSGIDATHPAFRLRDPGANPADPPLFPDAFGAGGENNTRIIGTYDFTPVRQLLDLDLVRARKIKHEATKRRMAEQPGLALELEETLAAGRAVSWTHFAPLLQIPHGPEPEYRRPINEHGTHVAAILAGDFRQSDGSVSGAPAVDNDLIGVCPTLQLYDLRVLGDDGRGDEFAVMAALQFVRGLNTEVDYLTIHGVNLSMAIKHDVANYACGRTPICDEAARLVSSGAIVVAAAGNEGYVRNPAEAFDFDEGYRSISITDPGNAEDVITVGATHGYRPLTYGVSYFSSRGPTGDGRRKPDLVAPGEKIWSAVPRGGVRTLDGTSMAAPHVSGCAALLIARHRELIGDPARVKRVLCASATDLGREPYFQGHGLVDVLRAIQAM